MKKVATFAMVFFLLSIFVGCAGLKPQMKEIQGSESKIFSHTLANLNLEFKVPVKATEVSQNIFKFVGSGMPDIIVFLHDDPIRPNYFYLGLDMFAKNINAMVFDSVKPDGYDWREIIIFSKNSNTKATVGYITRKHSTLLIVAYEKSFTNEELSEIRGSTHKAKVLFGALSELDSWVKIVSKDKSWVGTSSKEKENPKTSWKEASEKIEKLGELYNKGLITKEEYETKKTSLLQSY